MQTSQNDPTTTATTTTPTLAELLAARAAQIEEGEREQAQRDEQERQRAHLDARSHAALWVEECLTPQLADALRVHIGVDEAILATDNDDYDPAHLAGYIELAALQEEQKGAEQPSEEGAEEETEKGAEQRRWIIRLELHPFKGYYQTLHGPNAYTAILPSQRYHGARLDYALLDAIADYPVWMSHAEERAEAEREEQSRKQAQREEKRAKAEQRPRHYAAVEGPGSYDGQRPGLLWTGTHVHILTLDPRGDSGIMAWSGVLQSVTREWLLLNLDDAAPRALGAQRLIPIARVLEIYPLPDLAPDLVPDLAPSEAE
jgi:hypothetical protein